MVGGHGQRHPLLHPQLFVRAEKMCLDQHLIRHHCLCLSLMSVSLMCTCILVLLRVFHILSLISLCL